jgi:hypothetical protein
MQTTNLRSENSAPAESAVSVTPSDSADLATLCRAIYVGGAGNLNLDMADGTTIVFIGLSSGQILPVRAKRVRSTSTTATNIIALF